MVTLRQPLGHERRPARSNGNPKAGKAKGMGHTVNFHPG